MSLLTRIATPLSQWARSVLEPGSPPSAAPNSAFTLLDVEPYLSKRLSAEQAVELVQDHLSPAHRNADMPRCHGATAGRAMPRDPDH